MHPTVDPSALPLGDAITAYLDWHVLRGTTPNHRAEVARMLGLFATKVGTEVPLSSLSSDHCAQFLRGIRELGRTPNTQNAYYRTLVAFFNWLVADERLARSPMRRLPKPKVAQEQIRPLTAEELAAILAQPYRETFTGLRDLTFMAVLADTGLRLSEALGIRVRDIDSRARSIVVMGKGGKPRTVFYGETVTGLLRAYLKRRCATSGEDLIFVNSMGEALCRFTIGKRIRQYGKEAGVTGKRVSPHTLRHTFALSWLLSGGDAMSLQRLLGHTTPTMTSRYVNLSTQDLGRLHRKVSAFDGMDLPAATRNVPGEGRRRLR